MKRVLNSSLFIASLCATSSLNAGVLLDVEAGTGFWNANPSGSFQYKSSSSRIDLENTLSVSDNTNAYFYADINHAIALIPNIKIEHQKLKNDGNNSVNTNFGGVNFNGQTKSQLDLTQNDLVLYWGLPLIGVASAGILNIDFGVAIKQFDGHMYLQDNAKKEQASLDFTVPMGYLSAGFDIPFLDTKLSASTKIISYKGASLKDTNLKASIELPLSIPLIDINLDLGYKIQDYDITNDVSSDFDGQIKIKGAYAGISAKF